MYEFYRIDRNKNLGRTLYLIDISADKVFASTDKRKEFNYV